MQLIRGISDKHTVKPNAVLFALCLICPTQCLKANQFSCKILNFAGDLNHDNKTTYYHQLESPYSLSRSLIVAIISSPINTTGLGRYKSLSTTLSNSAEFSVRLPYPNRETKTGVN